MPRVLPHIIQRIYLLLGSVSVAAFNGQPSLPAFGLHHQRPQSRNPVDLGAATAVATPTPVSNGARAAGQLSRHQSAPTRPARHSIRRRPVRRGADESTQVVPARHRYRDVAAAAAAPTHNLRVVQSELARWRHQAINALCYARIALTTGLVWLVHAIAAPLHKQLGCNNFAASSLDHCIQLSRLFLGLARRQKDARTCLAKPGWWEVAPHGRCYADGGECFLY